MPLIPINGIGEIGVVRDQPFDTLPANAWTDAKNVVFREGQAWRVLGHTEVFSPPTVAPYWTLHIPTISTDYLMYAGLTKLHVVAGTTHTDVSRSVGGVYAATADQSWNGGILGGIPIVNNGVDDPQFWDLNIANNFEDLTNWPASTIASVIRTFKEFAIALDVTESGTRDPYELRWSDAISDPFTLPGSWVASATNKAGNHPLTRTSGFIIDGRALGDLFIIYKQDSIHSMQFIGGRQVFAFRELANDQGIFTRRCIANVRGNREQAFLGVDDIMLTDGRVVSSIATDRVRRAIYDSISSTNFQRCFVSANEAEKEVWFCIVEEGFTFPNVAHIWNWEKNTWGHRELPLAAHISYGKIAESAETYASITGTYANTDLTYNFGTFQDVKQGTVFADPTNTKLFQGEIGQQFDGVDVNVFVERRGLALTVDRNGRPKPDIATRKLLTEVYPHFTGQGTVQITIGYQDELEGPVVWAAPLDFQIGTDRKINPLLSGRAFAIRIEDTGADAWKLHGYDLNQEIIGRYF